MRAWQTAHTASRVAGAPVIYTQQGVTLSPVIGDSSFSWAPEWSGSSSTTWTVASGSLPGGLSLDSSTGEVSGTLTAAGLLGGGSGVETGDYEITLMATAGGVSSDLVVNFDCQGSAIALTDGWGFDGSSRLDSFFGAHDGTDEVDVTYTAGQVGDAIVFGTAEAYYRLPTSLWNALVGSSKASLAFSFSTTDASSNGYLFSLNTDKAFNDRKVYFFAQITGGDVEGRFRSVDSDSQSIVRSPSTVNDGAWHTAVLTVSLPDQRSALWIDGVEVDTDTQAFANTTWQSAANSVHTIGYWDGLNPGADSPNGSFDEFAMRIGEEWGEAEAATATWLQRRGVSLADWATEATS